MMLFDVFVLLFFGFIQSYETKCHDENCGDELLIDARNEASSEVDTFHGAEFSKTKDVVWNYTIAALTAIKLSQKTRNFDYSYYNDKLPKSMCPLKKYRCSYGKYRHSDGRCSNLFHPLSGAEYSGFSRRMTANYDDDISNMKLHARGRPLPTPNEIDKLVYKQEKMHPVPLASTFVEFSSLLFQDMSQNIKIQNAISCCSSGNRECIPLDQHSMDCYIRSAPTPLDRCSLGRREQMNLATASIDASVIYQNPKDISKGKFSSSFSISSGNNILSLLIDEHNRIFEQLQKIFPDLTTDVLYEESRKFVIAELQHITFTEYLPLLLGKETMKKYSLEELNCKQESCQQLDSNTLNEYVTVGQFFKFMKDDGITNRNSYSDIFRPSLRDSSSTAFSKSHLVELLLLGRDHGHGTYSQWREECGGDKLESFGDLEDIIDQKLLKSLSNLFSNVEDIDMILLGLAEKPVYGSLVGPTFGCVLALQFQKAKFGDSYWYENHLSAEQLVEIQKTSISSLMCRSLKTTEIQMEGFKTADSFLNTPISCNSTTFPKLDLSKWIPTSDQKLTNTDFNDVLGDCIKQVNEARSQKSSDNYRDGVFNSAALKSYGSMMLAKDEAVAEANVSFILIEATKKLIKTKNHELVNLQSVYIGENFGKKPDELCNPKPLPCDPSNPYRTYTGWCNNLEHPSWANTFRELKRLLPPMYEDGIEAPRFRSISGKPLPSPREISNVVHYAEKIEHVKYSHFLMEFGQFIDHDITHSPVDQNVDGTPLNCTSCDSYHTVSHSCFPIHVPQADPVFEPRSCITFVRSLPAQKTLGYRNQMNQISSYLDGSVMYGSTKCEGDRLRTFEDGKLKVTRISHSRSHYGLTLSQSDESEQDGCVSSPRSPCFIAGDDRNSQQTLLIAVHSVFHREHERISSVFKELNPHWDDERIYQETKKLISAEFAHIVYSEYLPIIVGQKMMDQYLLRPQTNGFFQGYESCDASILQPFAAAAFRFGHSTVTRFTPMKDNDRKSATRVVDLAAEFLNMSKIYDEFSVEQILGGMHGRRQMMTDRHIDDAVRNLLFSDRGIPGTGLDLIAINIQRGRDHGIPPYNQYRLLCGLERLTSFYSIFSDIDQDGLNAIAKVYDSPDDIDLFTGIVSEKPIIGGIVGPTAACIISEQFRRLKKCDRFYYETNNRITGFSAEQLTEIRKVSMSSLICVNTKIRKIAKDVFSTPDKFLNALVDCQLFEKVDLSKWREAPNCIYKSILIDIHQTKNVSPCTTCTCTSDGVKCSFHMPECSSYSKQELSEDRICLMQCAHRLKTQT